MTSARAKGLGEWKVVLKHVVETLFALPGLGTFGIDAIMARDYQQVQGVALITACAFVVMNLVVDLTYTVLDPRIRYGT